MKWRIENKSEAIFVRNENAVLNIIFKRIQAIFARLTRKFNIHKVRSMKGAWELKLEMITDQVPTNRPTDRRLKLLTGKLHSTT